jgi:hypothetical protein
MAKPSGITVRCVYCRRKWMLTFEEASRLTDMPPCPNRPQCAGFGIAEEATVRP